MVWTGQNHIKQCYYHVYYQKCVPSAKGNGGWVGTPYDVCTDHTTYAHCDPAVACVPGTPGRVVVTWSVIDEDGYAVGFREFASGKWQPQVLLDWSSAYYYRWLASISAASNGDVAVAYYGTQAGQPNIHVYVFRRVGGTWQAREDATAGLPGISFILPDIEVNPVTKNPHIVCHSYDTVTVPGTRYYHIYHTYRDDDGWTVPAMISDPAVRVDCQPSMFFASDGSANVVWNRETGDDPGIMYRVRDAASGTWGDPSFITHYYPGSPGYYDMAPNVTVSSNGDVYAVWMDGRNGPYQIWGRLCTPGSFGPMARATVTPHGFALDVSPNPVSRGMVVSYSLSAAGNVSLKLYDVSGALAKTVACGCVLPGSHAVSLSRQGLTRGAYILKLESGASSLTRKLIIE